MSKGKSDRLYGGHIGESSDRLYGGISVRGVTVSMGAYRCGEDL